MQGLLVQIVLDHVLVELVVLGHGVQVPKCLGMTAEKVVDGEVSAERRKLLQALEEREIFPGVLLTVSKRSKKLNAIIWYLL